jgi:hypothetical protein
MSAMWVFLSRRFRRWLLMAVAVPVIGAVARKLSGRIEEKHGRTKTSRVLGHVGNVAQSPRQKRRAARNG